MRAKTSHLSLHIAIHHQHRMKTWGAHFLIIRDRLLTHIIEIVLERILANEFVYFIQDYPRILHQALVLNQHESGGLHSMYSLSERVKGIA